jgi:hypothetical protein
VTFQLPHCFRDTVFFVNMGGSGDASIQAFFPLTPNTSPTKCTTSGQTSIGDGFTAEEVQEALKPKPLPPWQPPCEYDECDIIDLNPGPRAVTFTGRVANISDIGTTQKAPRSTRGCLKLCIKDDEAAITVCRHVERRQMIPLTPDSGAIVVCFSDASPATWLARFHMDEPQ